MTVHGLKSPFGLLSPLATQQTGYPLLKAKRILEILSKGFDVIHYHNISLVGGPKILEYGDGIKLYTMHDYWLVCPTHALFRFNRAPCIQPYCFLCTLVYNARRSCGDMAAIGRRDQEYRCLHCAKPYQLDQASTVGAQRAYRAPA